jgi:hypothetical protein
MADNSQMRQCFACRKSSEVVPLIALAYRDAELWICPQDLPVLIHHPEKLNLGSDHAKTNPIKNLS